MSKIPRLVIGTANRKRRRELAELFANVGVELLTLADFPDIPPIPEDGETFAANAILKASGYATRLEAWILADDSGLLVDALHGEPGVFSADMPAPRQPTSKTIKFYWENWPAPPLRAGQPGSFVISRLPIQRERSGRKARPVPGPNPFRAAWKSRFWIRPLFEILEYHRSFAELGAVVKTCLSHRACEAIGLPD